MARVITFSRFFPAHHPKAGQPTHFVEKIWKSIFRKDQPLIEVGQHMEAYLEKATKEELDSILKDSALPKHHTIRAGYRWKVGDKFSPRVWSGRPYNSKQIIIAPDIEVKHVWDFTKDPLGGEFRLNGHEISAGTLIEIAKNDGLSATELMDWFNKPFSGQIICWNDSINY